MTTAGNPRRFKHRAQLIELITRAEAEGRTRVAAMNQQVLTNLETIITALDQPKDPDES
jgi:hypothetical protein